MPPSQSDPLAPLVERARSGDRRALDELVARVQDSVYAVAFRILGNIADAEDATQEALVRIVTHLSSWRGESRFLTWVYRVAVNNVINEREKRRRHPLATFDELAQNLDAGLSAGQQGAPTPNAVDLVVIEETRLVCTQGMLLALDREHRVAFVLSELAELTGEECADILSISHDALRKRVSRARTRLADFMRGRCGVFDVGAMCRCRTQATCLVKNGVIDPAHPRLANHPVRGGGLHAPTAELSNLLDVVAMYRSHPDYAAPDKLKDALKELLR